MTAFCTLVIPARRNSKRVPGKNINLFAGKPLIRWSLDLWSNFQDEIDIIVSTDDESVLELASEYPHIRFRRRPAEFAADVTTLDELAAHIASSESLSSDYLALAQCTCPLLTLGTARKLLDAARSSGRDSIVAATHEHGFFWEQAKATGETKPRFSERVNTQYAKSVFLKESGAFTATRLSYLRANKTRFDNNPLLVPIPKAESIDIDDRADWRIGQALARPSSIAFVAICNKRVGTGHLHRCIEISSWFSDLEQQIIVVEGDGTEDPILSSHNLAHEKLQALDDLAIDNAIIVLDALDVAPDLVDDLRARGNLVFVFETRLPSRADFTFNSLYRPFADAVENRRVANGPRCAVTNKFLLLRENRFKFRDEVTNVVVFFGGTDPSNLRSRITPIVDAAFSNIAIHVFSGAHTVERKIETEHGNHVIERPAGAAFFAAVEGADLFIGSAGQTMMQVAHIGVPSVIVSHSPREEQHIFGDVVSCVTYAGCASDLAAADLESTIQYASSRYRRKLVSDYCASFSLSQGNGFVHRTMRELIEAWAINERHLQSSFIAE